MGRATLAGDLTDATISVHGIGSELFVGQTLFVGDNGAPPNVQASGLVEVSDGGRVVADSVQVERGGTISGSGGTLVTNARVLAGGTIAAGLSPGMLTFEGDVHFESGSILEIEIGGLAAGTEHDVLEVIGELTMNGTVQLVFIDGFAPRQDDRFEFLVTSGIPDLAGAEFEVLNLAPGFRFDVTPTANGIAMIALNNGQFVPEPSSGLLLAGGVAAFLLRHRRCRRCATPFDRV